MSGGTIWRVCYVNTRLPVVGGWWEGRPAAGGGRVGACPLCPQWLASFCCAFFTRCYGNSKINEPVIIKQVIKALASILDCHGNIIITLLYLYPTQTQAVKSSLYLYPVSSGGGVSVVTVAFPYDEVSPECTAGVWRAPSPTVYWSITSTMSACRAPALPLFSSSWSLAFMMSFILLVFFFMSFVLCLSRFLLAAVSVSLAVSWSLLYSMAVPLAVSYDFLVNLLV